MRFQVAGDYHISGLQQEKPDYTKYIVPKEKYLVTVGDIGQVYIEKVFGLYEYFAANWEKTFIIMGNAEYEMFWTGLSFTTETCENLMKQMIASINKALGAEKLVLIHHGFVDFPEECIRLAGLTLWSNGTNRSRLFTESDLPNDCTLRIVDDRILYTNPPEVTYELNSKWNATFTVQNTIGKRVSLTMEGLKALQEKEDAFLSSMIDECNTLNYELILVSHYLPTKKLENTGVFNKDRFDGDLYDYLARDKEEIFTPPIKAWICGHVHGKQKLLINNIPIYVNWDTVVTSLK
jgi:hypothetical protein